MKSFLHRFVLGCVIGLLIMPAQPAQAQWTVFDPSAYSQRLRAEIRRVREWVEEVQRYQTLYTNAVQQVTTLGGILKIVDKELAKDQETARLTSDLGDIIRDVHYLKRRTENMVRYQISALQSIRDRVENGIFDPDADLRDFEEYLLYSLGRSSRQTLQMIVRQAQADAQLTKWMDEQKKLWKALSEASDELEEHQKLLDKARKAGADPYNVQPLIDTINQKTALIAELKKQIIELEEKIARRVNEHGIRLQDMENFGYQVQATDQMWAELQITKDDIGHTFDRLILGGGP